MVYDLKNTNWDKIKTGLEKYLRIMQLVKTADVTKNGEFKKLFNGFYRIRQRSKEFYEALYWFLENHKNKNPSFEEALTFFYNKFQRLEPSFSSKIVATINPNLPVWDSEVLKRLKLKKPAAYKSKEQRFKETLNAYQEILKWYSKFLHTDEAKKMIKNFDKNIGIINITPIKKIDLILWQTKP